MNGDRFYFKTQSQNKYMRLLIWEFQKGRKQFYMRLRIHTWENMFVSLSDNQSGKTD